MPRLEHPTGDKAGPEQILSPGRFMASPAPATSTADLLSAAPAKQDDQPTAASSVEPEPAPPKRATKRRKP